MTARIEDYGLIGDCQTAALVSKDGSIDWLCWPRFDSGACFAALLGDTSNGRWRIAPLNGAGRTKRRYRPNTLILETNFVADEGEVTLIDFFSLHGENSHVVRLVVGQRGVVRMRGELIIRFDYGASVPWVQTTDDGALVAISGPNKVVLYTPISLRGEEMTTVGDFTISAGETVPFVLMHAPSHLPTPGPIDALEALRETQNFWERWTGEHRNNGPYAEAVSRSLITLKALVYAPTGGMVTAATTSRQCVNARIGTSMPNSSVIAVFIAPPVWPHQRVRTKADYRTARRCLETPDQAADLIISTAVPKKPVALKRHRERVRPCC